MHLIGADGKQLISTVRTGGRYLFSEDGNDATSRTGIVELYEPLLAKEEEEDLQEVYAEAPLRFTHECIIGLGSESRRDEDR